MRTLVIGLRFFVVGIVLLLLGGFTGWYFYIRAQTNAQTSADESRGYNSAIPTFNSPFGSTQANQISSGGFGTSTAVTADVSAPLWKVDPTPVAGMGFVQGVGTSTETLRYVARASGYVLSADPATHAIARLTTTLMPKIYEAYVSLDGRIIERGLDDKGNITTFLGTVSSTSTVSASSSTAHVNTNENQADVTIALTGTYTTPNIRAFSINPTDSSLFYLLPNTQGGIDAIAQQWDGSKKTTVFSSSIADWIPSALSDNRLILVESAADGVPGYAYEFVRGTLHALVRNTEGLTVLPKSGSSAVLYGSSQGLTSPIQLFIQTSSTTVSIPIATVADKCVWAPGISLIAYCAVPQSKPTGFFLNNWYRGSAHLADDWWKIDAAAGTAEKFYTPASDNASLDVKDPMIDPDGSYIAFINNTDQSLWVLRIAQ